MPAMFAHESICYTIIMFVGCNGTGVAVSFSFGIHYMLCPLWAMHSVAADNVVYAHTLILPLTSAAAYQQISLTTSIQTQP